jgi:dihydroorotate dehydrogenase
VPRTPAFNAKNANPPAWLAGRPPLTPGQIAKLNGHFRKRAQAVEAVKIPVVGAGGLYDGRGLAAMLSLGAVGVWMGTRFIASQEAHAGQMYRDVIVEATDEDTIRTKSYSGKPCA